MGCAFVPVSSSDWPLTGRNEKHAPLAVTLIAGEKHTGALLPCASRGVALPVCRRVKHWNLALALWWRACPQQTDGMQQTVLRHGARQPRGTEEERTRRHKRTIGRMLMHLPQHQPLHLRTPLPWVSHPRQRLAAQ
jgi:hypothetical protein